MYDRYNGQYTLPTSITAEPRIFRMITIRTILIVAVFAYFGGMMLSERVYPSLQIPYIIFNVLVAFFFCVNSRKNMQKRLYQSAIIMLLKNERFYKPIENPKRLPETIRQYEYWGGKLNYVEPEERN